MLVAALRRLGRLWPRSEPFDGLLSAVVAEVGEKAAQLEGPAEGRPLAFAEGLLSAYGGGLIEFRTREPSVASEVAERPVASALARLQLRSAVPDIVVTNLLGLAVRLEGALPRELLLRMDGTRDHATLIRETAELVASGVIPPAELGLKTPSAARAADALRATWQERLKPLPRLALLTTGDR